MASTLFRDVDTVIVGSGPSSLILSYILHGHIPYYARPHHDALLGAKLKARRNLLDLTPELHAHFLSSLRYSTQALPLNTLLDTLIRPNADTEMGSESCVDWRYEPDKAVSHLVLGNAADAGGQWTDKPASVNGEIGTLSYAEMLALPGYSFADHWRAVTGDELPCFLRPSRTQVAAYFKAYPQAVKISQSIKHSCQVSHVSRTARGFHIGSHGLRCRHLVLGSGIFSVNIPPPPLISPLESIRITTMPLLVVGSGFSAADVIISASPHRKIIHMFNWRPDDKPSPLRGCHHQAYPEYAGMYRQMKLAALASSKSRPATSPAVRKRNIPFFSCRDWVNGYEGIANATIMNVSLSGDFAKVTIRLESGDIVERHVGGIEYVVGRRGRLDYLDQPLWSEVTGHVARNDEIDGVQETWSDLISGRTLREKAAHDLEVAPLVFIIGSLTGDSLIRHAFGSCAYAAGKILDARNEFAPEENAFTVTSPKSPCRGRDVAWQLRDEGVPGIRSNGASHQDLHLDRRELPKGGHGHKV